MKFAVGIVLTAFRIFWGAEGAGAHWPGADAALLVLIPAIALFALAMVAVFRRSAPRPAAPSSPVVSKAVVITSVSGQSS